MKRPRSAPSSPCRGACDPRACERELRLARALADAQAALAHATAVRHHEDAAAARALVAATARALDAARRVSCRAKEA